MRALAVDPGSVRCGLAVSDELGTLATPLDAFPRTASIKRDAAAIAGMAERLQAQRIVVGLPLRESGEAGPEALAAEEFADRVRRYTHIPVVLWDERLSSFEAETRLREAGVNARKMRERIDSQAAAVILESYLNHLRDNPTTEDAA